MSRGTLDPAPSASNFVYGSFTLSGLLSQNNSTIFRFRSRSPYPRYARITVWAPSMSLAATLEIDLSFFSSGYLDVSVHRVPFHTLWIYVWMSGSSPDGFPHSDIRGSIDICSSPRLFAAYHVFLRLLVPRHPPYALSCLTVLPHLPSVTDEVSFLYPSVKLNWFFFS